MNVEARTLPHNLDAERSVLGAAIADNSVLDVIADRLDAREFFRDAHQRIYRSILALYAKGTAVDFVTLKDELKRCGELDDVGGPVYIASLTDGLPRATNAAYYTTIVKRSAVLRNVIDTANRLLSEAYDDDTDIVELIGHAEAELLKVSEQAIPGDLKSAQELVRDIFPVLEALSETRRPVTGVSTGLPTLDRYTRGLHGGNLIILGGRPGHGKSTLGLQFALHVAKTAPVAFFSVEMSQQEQMFRILATLAMVDGHHLQCGQLSMLDQIEVGKALATFDQRQFWHDETGSLTALQIRSRSRRLKAKHGLGLIVVDYLQLLNHPKSDSREQAVAQTGRLLKHIAKELNVPVLALCQLSRKADDKDRRPQLSDLRESGALEQDADVVLLLHRPQEKSNGGVIEIPPVELLIAKQRSGPTASVEMKWIAEQFRFAELETVQV